MSWDDYRNTILAQLQSLPALTCARVGKGDVLTSDGAAFGIVERGRLYFRVDDATRPAYDAEGMGPLRVPGGLLEAYYEVPFDVAGNPTQILEWARLAIAAARRAERR